MATEFKIIIHQNEREYVGKDIIYNHKNLTKGMGYIGSKKNWKGPNTYDGSVSSRKYKERFLSDLKTDEWVFEVLYEVVCDSDNRLIQVEKEEQIKRNVVKSENYYNASFAGRGFYGGIMPEEAKKSISSSLQGHKHSEETKNKISKSCKGYKHTEEAKQAVSKANQGKNVSEETKNKIRTARLGTKMSDVAKEKNRQAQLGKKLSEETKNKIREYRKNNIPSSITEIVECPHCDKSGAKATMTRWHFDNCKRKEVNEEN